MNKGDYLLPVYHSQKTVFSFKDLSLLWREKGEAATRVRINYYVKHRKLFPIRKGLYAKKSNYDEKEAATMIYTPSYISFETILAEAGIIFQFYKNIFVASYLSRDIECDEHIFSYHKIKDTILTNPLGIAQKENYMSATKERALLDLLYLKKNYYFDNLAPLNWNRVFELLPLYSNKRMTKKMHVLYKDFKNNH